MKLIVLVISVLWIVVIIYFVGLKLQLRSLRHQLEFRISASIKKPLALEMQDTDLMALTTALNQIFRQDEEFRRIQNMNENEYKELITNISHDLRTPLTVLKGYLQLLEHCEIDDTGKKYLSVCFRHTDELERRIRQFFEYSYWMNQDQELQLKIINITNIIVDTMTDFIPVFEEKGLTMQLDQDTICKGVADEELLRRVMQNLLKNCLQYSAGKVVVSITKDADVQIVTSQDHTSQDHILKDYVPKTYMSQDHISKNHAQKDRIRICVQNPIAEDSELDSSKIFQRFYVGKKERNQSTGLGLSIVKLLVEKMQGEVFVICDENLLSIGFYLKTSF